MIGEIAEGSWEDLGLLPLRPLFVVVMIYSQTAVRNCVIKDKHGYKGQLKHRALQCRTEHEPDATHLIFNQIKSQGGDQHIDLA